MGRIHRLDPVVANQIAAGEVVERPASIVKELLENSFDAKAGQCRVVLEEGGLARISVKDDGIGMGPEDLMLATERHTTSKLTRLDDLGHSPWLGFRGEALAAIASVSQLTLASRESGAAVGYALTVEFGRLGDLAPRAMSEGTQVEVTRLFDTVPARQKALKSPAAELAACQQVAQQLALCRPDVGITLWHHDRRLLETGGTGDRLAAIMAIFGRDLAEQVILIDQTFTRGLRIQGYVAPAHVHRANRAGQGLYLNRRWITNWTLRSAIEEAFKPELPDRRYPYFWLWLTLDPDTVDPNAHPTKAEVRLLGERQVAALCHRAVQDALAEAAKPFALNAPAGPQESRDLAPGSVLQPTWELSGHPAGLGSASRHPEYAGLVPLAQWQAKYILAQGPDGLYIIDQHAAHERIYFEHFRRVGEAVRTSQPLLMAQTETLSAAEWATYQDHRDHLRTLGFDLVELGGTTLAIQAVPTAFRDVTHYAGVLRTVLQALEEPTHAGMSHPISWVEEPLFAMAACKAAIKANRPLSHQEMQALIDDLAETEDPRGCPHGRPTILHLTLEEVDRRFGRRG